jgi:hypothetical protein
MSKRYSRIIAASRYTAQLAAYQKWLTGESTRQPNVGKKGARPTSQILYVIPFAYTLTSTLVTQSAGQPAWQAYSENFALYTFTAVPQGSSSIKIARYRAPRINVISNISTSATEMTSHITGNVYYVKKGKNQSVPFGNKTGGGATAESAFTSISATIQNVKCVLIPEKV